MFSRRELFILITIIMAIAFSSLILFFLDIKAAIGGFLMVIIGAVMFQFPRPSLYLFLIYLCFGGTITYILPGVYHEVGGKVIFTSIYPILHFVKDIFYFFPLIAIIIKGKSLKKLLLEIKPFLWVLLFFVAVCLLNFAFVNIPNEFQLIKGSPFLMGIIGLKIWLGYIPLILCGFYLIRNRRDLFFLTRLQTVLIIICCGFAFIQYLFLTTGICEGNMRLLESASNRASLQARCFVGGSLLYNPEKNLIRLPGTFVAPWQWGWFLISSIFFTVGSAKSESCKKWKILSWIGTTFVLMASIISGQRIALLLVSIMFITLILLTEKTITKISLKLGIVSFIIIVILGVPLVTQSIESFLNRWNYSPPEEFIWNKLENVINNQEEILGHGLGTTSSMARQLGNVQLIEVFPAQLIYEMGFLGLIAFFVLAFMIVFVGFKSYKSLQDNSLKNLGLCLWVFILFISFNIYYYPLLVDPVAVYYWFTIGILLKLPHIDRELTLKNEEYPKDKLITNN